MSVRASADRALLAAVADDVREALACTAVEIVLDDVPGIPTTTDQGIASGTGRRLSAELTGSDGRRLGTLDATWADEDVVPDGSAARILTGFALVVSRLVTESGERGRAEASRVVLQEQALTDPLTGVGNRSMVQQRLEHAVTARAESGARLAVLFVDIDHFKDVNDAHDHDEGDRVLQAVARRLQDEVRAHDTVARWGGDEFVVLLTPLADETAALGVVQRILAAVARPVAGSGGPIHLTSSIGVAFWGADTEIEPTELVRRADAAMLEAKVAGRDGFAVYDALDPATERHLHLRQLLALGAERVVVQYQPIVRLADGTVVGVEALLRLRDDDGTLVYPAELLSSGSVPGPVARAALRRACADVSDLVAEGHDLSLSVNVSPQQVADGAGFREGVELALEVTGLPVDRLTLELTEHTLLSTTSRTTDALEALVADGVRVSLDDFGTGFGVMSYVRALPVHELKVDRSFVQAAAAEPAAAAVLRSIASLAADLGARCVAEGVETVEQDDFLRAVGISLAQGLRYCAPVDLADLREVLRAGPLPNI